MKLIWKLILISALISLCLSFAPGCGNKDAEKQKAAAKSVNYSLDPIVVNLSDEDERYLRVTIGLKMKGEDAPKLLKDNENKVKDAMVMLLSGKYYSDVRDRQGKEELKAEIIKALDGVLKKDCVTKVYFIDFIAQ